MIFHSILFYSDFCPCSRSRRSECVLLRRAKSREQNKKKCSLYSGLVLFSKLMNKKENHREKEREAVFLCMQWQNI